LEAERWHRIDRLLAEALERPWPQRGAFLDEACGDDAGLRQAVEELLEADAGSAVFLDRPLGHLGEAPLPASPETLLGRRLGSYTLLEILGRGGMGVVYLASRDDGEYESRVAIKILPHGLGGEEVRRRFLAERQILARLDHPHIARLLDGGTTPEGLPYLVLEYVEGLPLDRYCDQNGLSLEARVELFRRVCEAVHYAHRHLLVHRDLKPANLLVTAEGEPKLLDFGIAKQLDPAVGASATHTGTRVMTPRYASPEQIREEPVTTASDVYSLGAVLYELLAGCSPYRGAEHASLHALEHAVCEEEPERPSAVIDRHGRAAEIARARGLRVSELRRRLRGDLHNIVLTALHKDPARRYASAAQLADDLERWQESRPVVARRSSSLYRAGLLLRRHRWGAAVAAVTLALLVSLLAGLLAERRQALRERNKALYAMAFLVDIFKGSDPFETGGERVTARQLLDHGAEKVKRELRGEPEVQASLMNAIGQAYLGLGLLDRAEPLLSGALERRRAGGASADLEGSLEALADLRIEQGVFAQATALYEQALALRRQRGEKASEIARTLNRLAAVRVILHRPGEAEELHREALALYRGAEGAEGTGTAETLVLLARLARDRGRYDEAERLFQEGIRQQRRLLGPRHPTLGANLSALALLRLDRGDLPGAERLLREALAIHEESLEPGHPQTLETLSNLAIVLYNQGNLAGAEKAQRKALALLRRQLGEDNPWVADVLANLGTYVLGQGRIEEAARLQEEALEIRRKTFGERHLKVAESLTMLTRIRLAEGRLPEAEDLSRRSAALLGDLMGESHPLRAYPLTDLGRTLLARGRLPEAEAILRQSLALRLQSLPKDHFEIARSRSDLGECLTQQRRFAEAEPLLLAAQAQLAGQFPPGDKRVLDTRRRLAALYRAWGRPDAARRYGEPSPGIP
jgi:serine/threonine-protein kinase